MLGMQGMLGMHVVTEGIEMILAPHDVTYSSWSNMLI